MLKKEFLKELEDRLQMLNEKERKDMIEVFTTYQYAHGKWNEGGRGNR